MDLLAAALALVIAIAVAGSAGGGPTAPGPEPPLRAPLALDAGSATQLFPNQSVTGTISAGGSALFKVLANRSDALPESLALTLEATGSLFGTGTLSVFDPLEVLLDEKSTTGPGQIQFSNVIAAETGFYLLEVRSSQVYDWALTVNLTVGLSFPTDNDNDLPNATALAPPSGVQASNLTDWSDLQDTYAIDLTVTGPLREALVVNLTSGGGFDLDLYIFHIEAGRAVIDSESISPTGFEYASALPTSSGRFFVRVLSYAGTSDYALEWAVFLVDSDPNGSPALATALPAGPSSNNLSRWDLFDFFRLDLAANTTVNISLHTEGFNQTSREPDLQAVVWDAALARVTWSFDFDPDERLNFLAPAYGTYFVQVFAADFFYYLSTALTFNYTIDARVDPPPSLADPLWNATLREDEPASFDLRVLIPPDPAGEALAYSVAGVSGPLAASLDPDGRTLLVTPDPDAFGSASVTVTATDRWRQVEVVLPVLIAAVNDPPRLRSGAGAVAFDEDGEGLFDAALAFVDPEGDAFSVTSFGAQAPLNATSTPQGILLVPPPNAAGPFALNVTVEDSRGAAAQVAVLVLVRPVNDPPSFPSALAPFSLDEDAPAEAAAFNLSGLAVDLEGDPLTYSLEGVPSVASLVVGSWLYLRPAPDFAGNVTGTLRAFDGALAALAPLTIRVLAIDDAPTLSLPALPLHAAEGAPFSFEAEAFDFDSPLSSLTFAFVLDGAPAQNASLSRTFLHTFDFESEGTHVLRVTVSDGERSASGDIIVAVSGTNRPPSALILAPSASSLRHGAPVAFSGRGSDPDRDPLNLTWIVDGSQVSSAPSFSLEGLAPGRHTVDLRVTDGEFTVTVSSTFEVAASTPGFGAALALAALAACAAAFAKRAPFKFSINLPKRLK